MLLPIRKKSITDTTTPGTTTTHDKKESHHQPPPPSLRRHHRHQGTNQIPPPAQGRKACLQPHREGRRQSMEEEQRQEAAAAPLIATVGTGEEHDDDGVTHRSSCCCCNLCGDVGFREALLPCGARGCSRLQHTYCGSRYCPDVVDDVKRWRCEWCAREDGKRREEQQQGEEEEEDSSRKRSKRVPPPSYYSSSPLEIKLQASSSSPDRLADKERRTACHREERRDSTLLPAPRIHAPQATSPSVDTDVPLETDLVMHKDKQRLNTRGGGGGSRALDRWKNLAKRTRLGGKKYKLLADVLC